MSYDAFISYRRENGFLMAQVLHDRLKQKGVHCYLDLEETTSGKFNEALIRAIQEAPNFILVLPPNALERCRDKNDWVRREILTAVQSGKNIIPVMYDGFRWPSCWPDEIPDDLRSIENHQGVVGTQDYLSAMIDKIISLMIDLDSASLRLNSSGPTLPVITTDFFPFYLDRLSGHITGIDMAFHAGFEWMNDSQKVDLLCRLLENQTPIRVLVNSEKAVSAVCSHMTQPLKRYVGFDRCCSYWKEHEKTFSPYLTVRILRDIPLLHRTYIIRSDNGNGACNIKTYTYGNYIPAKDVRLTFPAASDEYRLYAKEFEYLWNHSAASSDPKEQSLTE